MPDEDYTRTAQQQTQAEHGHLKQDQDAGVIAGVLLELLCHPVLQRNYIRKRAIEAGVQILRGAAGRIKCLQKRFDFSFSAHYGQGERLTEIAMENILRVSVQICVRGFLIGDEPGKLFPLARLPAADDAGLMDKVAHHQQTHRLLAGIVDQY